MTRFDLHELEPTPEDTVYTRRIGLVAAAALTVVSAACAYRRPESRMANVGTIAAAALTGALAVQELAATHEQ